MLKQKETHSSNLNEKLQQVKKMLQAHFSCIPISIPNSQAKSHLTKYNKKSDVEKENMILTYQLGLMANLLNNLQVDEKCDVYVLNKNAYDNEIKYKQLIEEKDKSINTLTTANEKINKQHQLMIERYNRCLKNIEMYEKKVNTLEKNGGPAKINVLQTKLKELKENYDKEVKENEKNKMELKKMYSRCKILEELNRQTQNKLSDFLVSNKIMDSKENSIKPNKIQEQKQKEYRLELMAARQEIKSLKQHISQLEKQKNTQKQKYEAKESMLGRMMMKTLRT